MWEELLRDVAIIKWGVVCIAVLLGGATMYLLLQEIPKWWRSLDKKTEDKPFTLEQMKKDLVAAERERPVNLNKLPKGTHEGGHY